MDSAAGDSDKMGMTKYERQSLIRDLQKFLRHEDAAKRRIRKAIRRLTKGKHGPK
jgi:hypothetical protein